jgi:hypothetical protein
MAFRKVVTVTFSTFLILGPILTSCFALYLILFLAPWHNPTILWHKDARQGRATMLRA